MRRTRTCRSTCPDSSASRSTPKLNDSIKRDKHHADTHASRRRPRRRRHRPRSHGRGAEAHGTQRRRNSASQSPATSAWSAAPPSTPAAGRCPTKPSRPATGADAILFGSVGGPKWDALPARVPPRSGRAAPPEKALRTLLQPASGPLLRRPRGPLALAPRHRRKGLRHGLRARAHGGIYFGRPKGREGEGEAERAFDTETYTRAEVRRIAKLAFRDRPPPPRPRDVRRQGQRPRHVPPLA